VQSDKSKGSSATPVVFFPPPPPLHPSLFATQLLPFSFAELLTSAFAERQAITRETEPTITATRTPEGFAGSGGGVASDVGARWQVAEEAGSWLDNSISRIIALLGLGQSSSTSGIPTASRSIPHAAKDTTTSTSAKSLAGQLRPKLLPILLAVRLIEHSRTPLAPTASQQPQQGQQQSAQQRQQLFHLMQFAQGWRGLIPTKMEEAIPDEQEPKRMATKFCIKRGRLDIDF
jgi:hypothetical protein